MPPPSPLAIATSSLQRLVKEEASYHRELAQQEKSIQRLQEREDGDAEAEVEEEEERGNRAFVLAQERRALEETKAVFPSLRLRIATSRADLEGLLASAEGGDADAEVAKAREVLEEAKAITA